MFIPILHKKLGWFLVEIFEPSLEMKLEFLKVEKRRMTSFFQKYSKIQNKHFTYHFNIVILKKINLKTSSLLLHTKFVF